MAVSHNAERTAKSADLKVVKMDLSEDDINNSALDRLREVQKKCESVLPASTVFLADIADILGVPAPVDVRRRASRLGLQTYTKRRGGRYNKPALCVSEEDAEKIIRSYYDET